VVVGGVAIFGGSGTATGAALGALLLTTINSALFVLGISSFWDQAIWGFLLLVAIALDQTITERLTSALRSRKPRSRNAGSRSPGSAKPGITSSPSSTGTRHA
jgi:rhamnose transport system permease protein